MINMLRTEMKRAFSLKRLLPVIALSAMLIVLSTSFFYSLPGYPLIMVINEFLNYGEFRIVFVVLLVFLHTGSFCRDENSKYLRMILTRTDCTLYTQCRFISNFLVITASSIVSVLLYAVCASTVYPVSTELIRLTTIFYQDIVDFSPWLYIGLQGLQLGVVAAACSSCGLLFSVYQPNWFVSIAISAITFYIWYSYVPSGTYLSLHDILSLANVFPYGVEVSWQINLAWSLFFPILVTAVCGYLFYRKFRRRIANGAI